MGNQELFQTFDMHRDPERAVQMKAYMRNQFEFLGVPAGPRRKLSAPFFKQARKDGTVDWEFLRECWRKDEREFQYVGADYLNLKKQLLTPEDVPAIKKLALTKPWWDTIDSVDKTIGHIALKYPEVNDTLVEWSVSDSIWLRRIAIDHQRLRKEQTDTELLEKIIEANLEDTEFFINKAIGWSLRDYSKTNPDWVRDFVKRHRDRMAPLSIREASKYLEKR